MMPGSRSLTWLQRVRRSWPCGVGAVVSGAFAPVVHRERMFSLDNVESVKGLEAWRNRVVRILDREPSGYACELKIDGLAISLRYEAGRFAKQPPNPGIGE